MMQMRQVSVMLSVLFFLGCSGNHHVPFRDDSDSRQPTKEHINRLIDDLAISSSTDYEADRARAFEAVEKLTALGKQGFPYLLDHLNDSRESVELQRLNRRQNVGEACYYIIVLQIFNIPPGYAIPLIRKGADGELHDRPFSAEQGLFDQSTISTWLENRKVDPLVALQVEALEWLLEQENKIGYPDPTSEELFQAPLLLRLESLRKSVKGSQKGQREF